MESNSFNGKPKASVFWQASLARRVGDANAFGLPLSVGQMPSSELLF